MHIFQANWCGQVILKWFSQKNMLTQKSEHQISLRCVFTGTVSQIIIFPVHQQGTYKVFEKALEEKFYF